MFKLFKRATHVAPHRRRLDVPGRLAAAAPVFHEPPPVPEVKEDHGESAWSQWEESSYQLDSQLGALPLRESVRLRDPSSQWRELDVDPFSRIGRSHR